MGKLTNLTFLFCISVLFQFSNGTRMKREEKVALPNLFLGEEVLTSFKNIFNGNPQDQDQDIIDQQFREYFRKKNGIRMLRADISRAVAVNPIVENLEKNYNEIVTSFNSIDKSFSKYRAMRKSGKNASDESLLEFARTSTSFYQSPEAEVKKILEKVAPTSESRFDDSILNQLAVNMKNQSLVCDSYQSQQHMLQNLFVGIGIAEFKAFLMMEFSYRKLAEVDQADYESEMAQLKNKFSQRVKKWTSKFEQNMATASRGVFPCDPLTYTEDENYFQMHIFQKYAVPDSDINSYGYCDHQCDRFTGDREAVHGDCSYTKGGYSVCYKVRKCKGNLYACSDALSGYNELWTCPSPSNSPRRYEYMVHGYDSSFWGKDLRRYGDQYNNKSCSSTYTYDTRGTYNFRVCETCLCVCQDSDTRTADQKVNIRPIVADKDHVITGVKWIKKNHILTMAIEQGKILPGGMVDADTIHWKGIQEPRDDSDLESLKWLSLRGFVLQDLEVPKGNVLVGVKLATMDSKKYIQSDIHTMKLFTPQLLSVPYDYTTGKLNYETDLYEDETKADDQSIWDPLPQIEISDSNSAEPNIGEGRVPTEATSRLQVVDSSWVLLDTSYFQTDAGQNTIPFFDSVDNIVDPPIPLSGIGIYFKNQKNYGGFLALKAITFDQSPYAIREV